MEFADTSKRKNVCRVALKSADLYSSHISLQCIISQGQPAHMTADIDLVAACFLTKSYTLGLEV